jgi:hypothetical protein
LACGPALGCCLTFDWPENPGRFAAGFSAAREPLMAWNWPVRWMDSFTRAACEEKGSGRAAGVLEKKLRCAVIREVTAGLTGRSDTRRLSRVGTTGRLPVIM